MRKIISKILVVVVCLVFLVGASPIISKAAGASIAVQNVTVTSGEEVTVNITTTGDTEIGGVWLNLSYDPSQLEYISSNEGTDAYGGNGEYRLVWLFSKNSPASKQVSMQVRFKAIAGQETKASVKVEAEVGTSEGDPMGDAASLKKTGTVTIKAPGGNGGGSNGNTQPSNKPATNVSLASLSVSPGTLSPAFSPDQTHYTMSIGSDQERIVVSAPAADAENTRVNISGATKLKVGKNTVTITVSAKDGSGSKKYIIEVTREEGTTEPESPSETETEPETETKIPVTGVTINGKEYQFVSDFSQVSLPEGFEQSAYSYKGTEVTVGKGIAEKLILFALISGEEGSQPELFLYDEDTDAFIPYICITVTQKMYTILPIPSDLAVPAGYEAAVVTIDGKEVNGFTNALEQEDGCYLVYAMNWDGETGLYRYDSKEGTMQRLSNNLSDVDPEQYAAMKQELEQLKNQQSGKEKILLFCTIGFAAAALAELLIIIAMLMKKRNDKQEMEEETGEIPDLEAAILAEAGLTDLVGEDTPDMDNQEEETPEAGEQPKQTEETKDENEEDGTEELAVTAVEEEDIFQFFEEEEAGETNGSAVEEETAEEEPEEKKVNDEEVPVTVEQPEISSQTQEKTDRPDASEEDDFEFFDL